MKKLIKNSFLYRAISLSKKYRVWEEEGFTAPSPHFIKQTCLLRNGLPNATWIETGTYLGRTTEVLAKHGVKVYSIEPEPTLFKNAKEYFSSFKNVEIINGLSEKIFPTLLKNMSGDVNFWLDGHYSAGITHKGPQDTPILEELKFISDNLSNLKNICVLVDDVRCFNPSQESYATYPSIDALVDWARSNKLDWHIEHDIFVAKSKNAA